jgi:hypothetical protein
MSGNNVGVMSAQKQLTGDGGHVVDMAPSDLMRSAMENILASMLIGALR